MATAEDPVGANSDRIFCCNSTTVIHMAGAAAVVKITFAIVIARRMTGIRLMSGSGSFKFRHKAYPEILRSFDREGFADVGSGSFFSDPADQQAYCLYRIPEGSFSLTSRMLRILQTTGAFRREKRKISFQSKRMPASSPADTSAKYTDHDRCVCRSLSASKQPRSLRLRPANS